MNCSYRKANENTDIGEKIKYLRLKKGLTLKELAKEVYTTDATLSRRERGVASPCIDDMVLLAKTLNFSIDELAGLKNDN